ncbi:MULTISPECIES: hypothetical protein [Streptomyces]|uniref:hypothetical protein n=1 Tax=Streptomyces TaxID=1883 RepID=UPI000B9E6EC7|nr:hypothetical protein [Streptomyces kasugaensis]
MEILARGGPGAMGAVAVRVAGALPGVAETGAAEAVVAEAAAVPPVPGLAQLLYGTRVRPGAHPPEAVIDAGRFFADPAREVPTLVGTGTGTGTGAGAGRDGAIVEVAEAGRGE